MSQEQQISDILEIVSFLKDEMVGRKEFDQKLEKLRSDLTTHMDGFIGLHQKLDLELVAMRAKYDRLESYIEQLARHANVTLQ